MKNEIKQLIEASIKGLIYIMIASPFLAGSCFILGLVVKMAINVFMSAFNLW